MDIPLIFTADIIPEAQPKQSSGGDWLSNFAIHFDEHGIFFLLLLIIAPILLVARFIRWVRTSGNDTSPVIGAAEFGVAELRFRLPPDNLEVYPITDISAIELHEDAQSDNGALSVILLTLTNGRRVHHRFRSDTPYMQARLHELVQIWRRRIGTVTHLRSGFAVPQ